MKTRIVELGNLLGESSTHPLQFLLYALRKVMRTEKITSLAPVQILEV